MQCWMRTHSGTSSPSRNDEAAPAYSCLFIFLSEGLLHLSRPTGSRQQALQRPCLQLHGFSFKRPLPLDIGLNCEGSWPF